MNVPKIDNRDMLRFLRFIFKPPTYCKLEFSVPPHQIHQTAIWLVLPATVFKSFASKVFNIILFYFSCIEIVALLSVQSVRAGEKEVPLGTILWRGKRRLNDVVALKRIIRSGPSPGAAGEN